MLKKKNWLLSVFRKKDMEKKEVVNAPHNKNQKSTTKQEQPLDAISPLSNGKTHRCRTNLKRIHHRRTFTGHSCGVPAVAIFQDGTKVISGGAEGSLRVWDATTGNCIRTIEGAFGEVQSVCISADERLVLSGSVNGTTTLCLWDIATGELIKSFEYKSDVNTVCLSPDGKYAASSGGNRNHLKLWEVSTGECIRDFEGYEGIPNTVAFSPDGQWLYSGVIENSFGIWHISKNKCIRIFKAPNSVSTIVPHPNGKHVFTAGSGSNVYLWDFATGELLYTFEGRRGYVASICLSLDGRFLFSGGGDKTISVWDVDNRKGLVVLPGHTEGISSLSLSRDTKWLVSSSGHYQDKILRLWELEWELEEIEEKDWSEKATPYLETFLTLHCKYGEDGLSKVGKPIWDDEDFKELLYTLDRAGYGWLRPEGIRKKLEETTASWQGPPPLLRE